ncbi:Arc-like DNA binding domain protein [Acetobacter malorum]|uniref:Arc-like DNA binding domain protein n=1 Tax=Acetobacter malorum TaxID=178901 RepID=A0A177G6M7_9PROT|nr:Arc-like DNA binding domain protein [Acetobacter malorum]
MQVRDWAQFRVRMPPRLWEQLKSDAQKGYRSLNSEVVMILENHFAAKEKASGSGLATSPDASGSE